MGNIKELCKKNYGTVQKQLLNSARDFSPEARLKNQARSGLCKELFKVISGQFLR